MFPLLDQSKNPDLFVYTADYSPTAVDVVQNNRFYDSTRSSAFVWDFTSKDIPKEIEPESLDMIEFIFVLSALAPDQWNQAIENVYKMLKPGGMVMFRDYDRYDLVQLRFKKNRLLKENFYIRGDGTRVYFFAPEEIAKMFGKFTIKQNVVEKRLIVNRQKKIKNVQSLASRQILENKSSVYFNPFTTLNKTFNKTKEVKQIFGCLS